MALDPSIILRGQAPDILGSMQRGAGLAQQHNEMQQQNALAAFLRENGEGLMSGDQNALAQYAQYDPTAAFNMHTQNRNNARADEQMAWQRQRAGQQDARQSRIDQRGDQEWQMKLDQYARGLSAEQRETEAKQIEDVLAGAAHFYEAGDEAGYSRWLQQNRMDPAEYSFGDFPAHAQMYGDVAKRLRGGGDVGLTPIYGRDDEGNPVVLQTSKDGRAVRTELPEGVSIDLAVRSREAARGTAEGKAGAEAAADLPNVIGTAERAISNLTAIREDPALASITGMIQGRLPPMTQAGTDLNTRIEQAQGQAFLEAFESLKGGGQITEIEGLKAERAIARLNRAQSTEAYQAALDDLIEVLQAGVDRAYSRAGQGAPQGQPAAQQPAAQAQPQSGAPDFSTMSDEELADWIAQNG